MFIAYIIILSIIYNWLFLSGETTPTSVDKMNATQFYNHVDWLYEETTPSLQHCLAPIKNNRAQIQTDAIFEQSKKQYDNCISTAKLNGGIYR